MTTIPKEAIPVWVPAHHSRRLERDCCFGASQPAESRISRYFRTQAGPARFYRLRATMPGG